MTCQYDLRNLTEHRCPECGRPFDPSDDRTFDRTPRRRDVIIGMIAIIFAAAAIGLQLLFFTVQCARQGS